MIALAVMAALNTGAMAAADRRRELLLARLGGATRRQVRRALVLEAGVATGVGVGVGLLVAFISTSAVANDPTGGPLALPLGQFALVALGGAALGLAALLGPAALLNRTNPTTLSGART
jgi:putative ABC transport system permease protein